MKAILEVQAQYFRELDTEIQKSLQCLADTVEQRIDSLEMKLLKKIAEPHKELDPQKIAEEIILAICFPKKEKTNDVQSDFATPK